MACFTRKRGFVCSISSIKYKRANRTNKPRNMYSRQTQLNITIFELCWVLIFLIVVLLYFKEKAAIYFFKFPHLNWTTCKFILRWLCNFNPFFLFLYFLFLYFSFPFCLFFIFAFFFLLKNKKEIWILPSFHKTLLLIR